MRPQPVDGQGRPWRLMVKVELQGGSHQPVQEMVQRMHLPGWMKVVVC
jgi:hypothetical protein